jgi:hypothetical protein
MAKKKDVKKEAKKKEKPLKVGATQKKKNVKEMDICTKAPEWAEHERFQDTDEPCDDHREGREE